MTTETTTPVASPASPGSAHLVAAEQMDWQQVVLNGGPPCFRLCEDGRFCGRAERWHSDDTHSFVTLVDLLRENAPSAERVELPEQELERVVRRRERASECERWRVDEWCEARDSWRVIEHHETYAIAEAQLDYLMKTCAAPKRRWRVVWIRERVQLLS